MNIPTLVRSLPLLMLMLAACAPGGSRPTPVPPAATVAAVAPTSPPTAVPTAVPTVVPTPVPTAIPTQASTSTPVVAAPSFAAQTYEDPAAGFAFDYPADWTLDPSSQVGVRGAQALLLSPGTTPETVADGGTRVAVTVYLWDPKHDLDAYVAQRKIAWDASGFAYSQEDEWQLADGRTVYSFLVRTPDVPTLYLLTTVGEDYLVMTGDGDLTLFREIAHTLRPLDATP